MNNTQKTTVIVLIENNIISAADATRLVRNNNTGRLNIEIADKDIVNNVFKTRRGLAAYVTTHKHTAIVTVFKKKTNTDSLNIITAAQDTNVPFTVFTNKGDNWTATYFNRTLEANLVKPLEVKIPVNA